MKRLRALPAKIAGQLRLIRRDPEAFARNILQVTDPARFADLLADVLNAVPMQVRVDPAEAGAWRLNVLDATWSAGGMTGGPNTAVNLAFRIARLGVEVRFVATVQPPSINADWMRSHAGALVGAAGLPRLAVESAAEAARPLAIGPRDIFLATHWTTALQLAAVLPWLPVRRFFYLLQEFEPGFYAWSSNYARAMETYGMDFWPVVNEALLADYLFSLPFGRWTDPATRERAVVFEPAVDRARFHAAPAQPAARRLLFYARPTNTRNMFGLGLMALRAAAADPVFAGWQFLSIGSRGSLPDMPLGHGHVLRPAPWVDYAGYGEMLRQADVLLCPMLSPHTSYPVLEMAACGGLAVTNTFLNKTEPALRALSANIVATEPTVDGLARGLVAAARAVAAGRPRDGSVSMAGDWAETLDPAARRIAAIIGGLERPS
jgi:hypothetical protein